MSLSIQILKTQITIIVSILFTVQDIRRQEPSFGVAVPAERPALQADLRREGSDDLLPPQSESHEEKKEERRSRCEVIFVNLSII